MPIFLFDINNNKTRFFLVKAAGLVAFVLFMALYPVRLQSQAILDLYLGFHKNTGNRITDKKVLRECRKVMQNENCSVGYLKAEYFKHIKRTLNISDSLDVNERFYQPIQILIFDSQTTKLKLHLANCHGEFKGFPPKISWSEAFSDLPSSQKFNDSLTLYFFIQNIHFLTSVSNKTEKKQLLYLFGLQRCADITGIYLKNLKFNTLIN
jgi:hypothetical protein